MILMKTAHGWSRYFWGLGVLGIVLAPLRASAWGEEGHQTVATVAGAGLSATAKKQIRDLLGATAGNETARMVEVALWADKVRQWHQDWEKKKKSDPSAPLSSVTPPGGLNGDELNLASDFILGMADRFEAQRNRHFVDLPLGSTDYDAAMVGTGEDDVVHAINRCVLVLQGSPLPGEIINQKQALRFLIHFIGDIHQPLHAGIGYWMVDPATHATRLCTPAEASTGLGDQGGNLIKLMDESEQPIMGPFGQLSFHAYWDVDIVEAARKKTGTKAVYRSHLINDLVKPFHPGPVWYLDDSLTPLAAAKLWSVESTEVSSRAYPGLNTQKIQVTMGPDGKPNLTGNAILPMNYAETFRADVNIRLARGGLRLAQMLNSLWP